MPRSYRLFEANPRLQRGQVTSNEVLNLLNQFFSKIEEYVGSATVITIYPHRVFNKASWNLKIVGKEKTLNLLLNISGVFHIPEFDTWPARLVIEMIDSIDTIYFVSFLSEKYQVPISTPSIDLIIEEKEDES